MYISYTPETWLTIVLFYIFFGRQRDVGEILLVVEKSCTSENFEEYYIFLAAESDSPMSPILNPKPLNLRGFRSKE